MLGKDERTPSRALPTSSVTPPTLRSLLCRGRRYLPHLNAGWRPC